MERPEDAEDEGGLAGDVLLRAAKRSRSLTVKHRAIAVSGPAPLRQRFGRTNAPTRRHYQLNSGKFPSVGWISPCVC